MERRVPKCWHINFRRRGITQKKAYNNWIFLRKKGYIGNLKWQNISINGCSRLNIYLRKNKTLLHNSLYVVDNWGKHLSYKEM